MMFSKKALTVFAMFLAVLLCAPSVSCAAGFPQKPVLTIIPYSPGGGNDILIRLVAKYIPDALGKSLIVENKPGAGGQIGWTALSKARPDGYTIGAGSLPSMIMVKSLRENVPFELSDFQYICNIQVDPIIWVVNKDSKIKTPQDIVDFAKANPGKMNVVGDGPQSNVQLQHLVACDMLGITTNFVPYSGSGAALTALMGGQADLGASTLSAAKSHIESGRIIPIVLFYDTKLLASHNAPTAKEAFGKDIPNIGLAMRGVIAPKGVDAGKIAILEKAFEKAVNSPGFMEQAKSLGLNIRFIGSAESNEIVKTSTELVEKYKSLF